MSNIKQAIKELQERINIGKKNYAQEMPEYIETLEIAVQALKNN